MQPTYHPIIKRQLESITKGAASYLLIGQPGSGRSAAVRRLAERLNCPNGGDDTCAICQNLAAGSYPDYLVVRAEDKKIGLEQIQALGASLANRPLTEDSQRIVYIDADSGLTMEAQNRLLKTYEEPPAQTIIIIGAISSDQILPTIRSRSQIIHFLPLGRNRLRQAIEQGLGRAKADEIMKLRPATIGQALALAGDPAEYNHRLALQDLARQFVAAPLFQRMTLVGQKPISDQPEQLLDAMATVSFDDDGQFAQLTHIERAKRRLRANVGARSVLEALAIEL